MADTQEQDDKQTLRSRAERVVHERAAEAGDLAAADLQRVLHELQVHEIELELQNEELRTRQMEYQELYERYVDLYNFAPIGYVVLDREGRIVEANLTLGRMLGVVRSRIVDKLLARFVVAEDQDLLHLHLHALWGVGEHQSWRLRLRRADGGMITCQVDAQPVFTSEGQVIRSRLAFTDISALADAEAVRIAQHQELQRAMEELRMTQARLIQHERLSAIGQLAAGVAHDFNNILASVLLYGQMMLRSEGLTGVQRRWVESMISESRRGSELVEQILDFGQRATLEPERFSLVPFVQEVARLMSRTLPDNIDVRTVTEDESASINADRARMQQVLVNLALNARDAMPSGGRLTLTVDRTPPEKVVTCASCGQTVVGRWVTVSVTDTGHGIADDVLPHIFEPFFTTRSPEGHGLGLSQVAGIVAQHGGHIAVETAVGEGTTVHVYLPEISERPPEQAVVAEAGEAGAVVPPLVLVVEDNPTTRLALAEALSVLGYRTESALHGREALDILARPGHGIALILTDWVMPQMGGAALLEALRARGIQLPVVVVSGHPRRFYEDAETHEVADWLQKPVELKALGKSVAAALR
ncbi:MAG: response regulator [Anaerolineae bacterium]|nr:response regulator [Anaerolineae bacterium]